MPEMQNEVPEARKRRNSANSGVEGQETGAVEKKRPKKEAQAQSQAAAKSIKVDSESTNLKGEKKPGETFKAKSVSPLDKVA